MASLSEQHIFDEPKFREGCEAAWTKMLAEGAAESLTIIVLTACEHGAGVTSTAIALSHTMANHCEGDVVVVEATVRKPSASLLLGLQTSPGFIDLLDGSSTIGSACQSLGGKLSLIVAGHAPRNPTQLLSPARIKPVFDELAERFCFVVVDAPPVDDGSPEALALSSLASGAILVLKAGSSRRQVLEHVKRKMERTGANLIGAILNERRYWIPQTLYRQL